MNGELARIVALAGHGNCFLLHRAGQSSFVIDSNSTFQYVNSVKFFHEGHTQCPATELSSPAKSAGMWLQHLLSEGVIRLWVFGKSSVSAGDPVGGE